MKKNIVFAVFVMILGSSAMAQNKSKVQHLTYKEFLSKVWDFEKHPKDFVFKGKIPAIVDFYADWCGPCRKVGPIMEKLATEYDGKLSVYKVNVDQEKELAAVFQVRSIPFVLFIPKKGKPMMQAGAMGEQDYRKIVEEQLVNP